MPDAPGPRTELDRLAGRAAAGDEAARAAAVGVALPLLRRWAHRYAGRGVEVDDLVQDAVVGLLRALASYEPGRGVPFTPYARLWVRQALQQAVAEQARPVRLPTHVLWDLHELKEARERLRQQRLREPRLLEVADALGWNVNRVGDVLRAEHAGESLDRAAGGDGDGDGAALGDLLADPLSTDAYEDALTRIATEQVRPLLLALTERERAVLERRAAGASLRTVGRELGVSGERVRAIEGRALAKLRISSELGG